MSDLVTASAGFRLAAPVAALALSLLAACSDKPAKNASQVAARVNDNEISVHQINFALQQQGVPGEQLDKASKQVLERLIEQELAVQKALERKMDREPRVLQALEAARREVLARAYVERVADAALKPTREEIERFYNERPALFAERRIYRLHELQIEADKERLPALGQRLNTAKNVNEFVDYLRNQKIRFSQGQAVRAAEQLPLDRLEEFAGMRDGQARMVGTLGGASVVVLVASQSQPVALEKAQPAIEQYLTAQRRRELVERDMKELHAAANIQYMGKFVETATSAPAVSPPDAPPVPAAPGAAASAPSSSSANQGKVKQ